jgi:hypothetical protein
MTDGEKMLLMAPDMVEALDGARMDSEDTEQHRRVVISRCTADA